MLCTFLCCLGTLAAQEMARTVVGNAGTYYDNLVFGDLHFTVGEIAVSNLSGDFQLAEGFHHGYFDLLVKTDEPIENAWQVAVYPNPTTELVNIQLPDEAVVTAQLWSTNGQLLQQQAQLRDRAVLDVSTLPAGSYWLRLVTSDGRHASTYPIQKL